MVSKRKSANPADAARKAARQRELKKNRAERQKVRETITLKKDVRPLEGDIRAMQAKASRGELSKAGKEQLEALRAELAHIRKVKDEYLEKHPEHRRFVYPHEEEERRAAEQRRKELQEQQEARGPQPPPLVGMRGRVPSRSVYYDPVFNPTGAPPPGMPYLEKPPDQWDDPEAVAARESWNATMNAAQGAGSGGKGGGEGEDEGEDHESDADRDGDEEEEEGDDEEDDEDGIVLPEGPPPPPSASTSANQEADRSQATQSGGDEGDGKGDEDEEEDEDGIVMPSGPPPAVSTAVSTWNGPPLPPGPPPPANLPGQPPLPPGPPPSGGFMGPPPPLPPYPQPGMPYPPIPPSMPMMTSSTGPGSGGWYGAGRPPLPPGRPPPHGRYGRPLPNLRPPGPRPGPALQHADPMALNGEKGFTYQGWRARPRPGQARPNVVGGAAADASSAKTIPTGPSSGTARPASLPPRPGPPPARPQTTISAAPQLRDLRKEATAFVPAALQRRRATARHKASLSGLPGAVDAAPLEGLDEGDDHGGVGDGGGGEATSAHRGAQGKDPDAGDERPAAGTGSSGGSAPAAAPGAERVQKVDLLQALGKHLGGFGQGGADGAGGGGLRSSRPRDVKKGGGGGGAGDAGADYDRFLGEIGELL